VENNKPYILWLPSWYPNKLRPYDGDFIQRHAKAVALYNRIEVLYIVRDENGSITKNVQKDVIESEYLKETIVYYYISPKKIKIYEKALSFLKYVSIYKTLIKELFIKKGKPQLVKAYIAMKAGIIALWILKKYKVPYVVAEQWSVYLSEARPNLSDLPFYIRKVFEKKLRKELKKI